jgi:hypothetical protein
VLPGINLVHGGGSCAFLGLDTSYAISDQDYRKNKLLNVKLHKLASNYIGLCSDGE